MQKILSYRVEGTIIAKVSFEATELEKAIDATIEARDVFGLNIRALVPTVSKGYHVMELRKIDTLENFSALVEKAKKLGWT
jgi:hypothetical protein